MIGVNNLTKIYGSKKVLKKNPEKGFLALNNINFRIPDGASVAIVGKSGSGKSTLMHVMSGLDKATKGSVTVDNVEIFKLKGRKLDKFRAKSMGFIFQSFFVQANDTCYNNVALPLEIMKHKGSERKKLIRSALESVELGDKINEKAGNLSGGQKQRLAIARAIVGNPSIIFADEPTGNLDSFTGKKVEDILFGFNKDSGVTLIVVTHDADLAKKCDIQIVMKDGEVASIIEYGNKKELEQ